MVTDSSAEGNGSTRAEEPELDVPLTGSPIAESTICAFLGISHPPASLDPPGEPTVLYTWWIKMCENYPVAHTADEMPAGRKCALLRVLLKVGHIKKSQRTFGDISVTFHWPGQ